MRSEACTPPFAHSTWRTEGCMLSAPPDSVSASGHGTLARRAPSAIIGADPRFHALRPRCDGDRARAPVVRGPDWRPRRAEDRRPGRLHPHPAMRTPRPFRRLAIGALLVA